VFYAGIQPTPGHGSASRSILARIAANNFRATATPAN
jgi:hypothetical protein